MVTGKKIGLFFVLFFIFYFLLSGTVFAEENLDQKILDLRRQIEELEKQADQYKDTIQKNQKQAKTLQREIENLNNQISRLRTKILVTEKQITSAKFEINDLSADIFDTHEKIVKKQKTVGEILSIINDWDNQSLLALLVKNNELSDFFNQVRYNQNLQKKLVLLLADLKNTKQKLENEKTQLEIKKQELERLNSSQKNKKIAFDGNKYQKDVLLNKTRGQEAQYQKLLQEVERKEAEFFAELQKLENQAVETGAYILRVKTDIPPKSKIFSWPEDDYIITQPYGSTPYSRRGAYGGAPHNGIDMTAGYRMPIKSIGNGRVLVSGINDGWGHWAAVHHDNGLVSLYSHFRAPSGLANGTRVQKGDTIGFEGSSGNSTGPHLHLSLYHEFFTFFNPRNGQLYFNYFDGTLNPLDYLE